MLNIHLLTSFRTNHTSGTLFFLTLTGAYKNNFLLYRQHKLSYNFFKYFGTTSAVFFTEESEGTTFGLIFGNS